MLHCSTHISTQCIYTHIYLYVPLGNLKRVKVDQVIGVSCIKMNVDMMGMF